MASRAIKSRANIKKKHPSTAVIAVAAVIFAFIVSLCWGVWSVGSSWLSDLPDYKSADAYNTAQPTVVYASDGQTVLAEFQLENRDPVEINEISDSRARLLRRTNASTPMVQSIRGASAAPW